GDCRALVIPKKRLPECAIHPHRARYVLVVGQLGRELVGSGQEVGDKLRVLLTLPLCLGSPLLLLRQLTDRSDSFLTGLGGDVLLVRGVLLRLGRLLCLLLLQSCFVLGQTPLLVFQLLRELVLLPG